MDPISSEIYEVKSLKKHIIQNLPVHLGLSVYCESKVHMLKFYYIFLKKYLEDKCFTLLFSDTDSIYVAISRPALDDCVKPSLRKEYFTVKRKWMPADSCNDHFDEYLECKLNNKEWKPSKCCQDFKKHENRLWLFLNKNTKDKILFHWPRNCISVQVKMVINQDPKAFKSNKIISPSKIISKFWKPEFPKRF